MSRFIRDCDPPLIRHRSRDSHHSKGNAVSPHDAARLTPLPSCSKFLSLAIFHHAIGTVPQRHKKLASLNRHLRQE